MPEEKFAMALRRVRRLEAMFVFHHLREAEREHENAKRGSRIEAAACVRADKFANEARARGWRDRFANQLLCGWEPSASVEPSLLLAAQVR